MIQSFRTILLFTAFLSFLNIMINTHNVLFQFEIMNILVSSFRFILIPVLSVVMGVSPIQIFSVVSTLKELVLKGIMI